MSNNSDAKRNTNKIKHNYVRGWFRNAFFILYFYLFLVSSVLRLWGNIRWFTTAVNNVNWKIDCEVTFDRLCGYILFFLHWILLDWQKCRLNNKWTLLLPFFSNQWLISSSYFDILWLARVWCYKNSYRGG